jgi:hypothetical protein
MSTVGKGFLCATFEPQCVQTLVNDRDLCMASSFLSYANSIQICLAPFFQDLKRETGLRRIVTKEIKTTSSSFVRICDKFSAQKRNPHIL